MTQTNDILSALLSNFPIAELSSGAQRTLFETLRTRLCDAPDAAEELKNLYKVRGFSDFALGLMWIVERASKNPGQISIGPEDETLLLSSFRRAVSEGAPQDSEEPAAGQQATAGGQGEGEIDVQVFAGQLEQLSDAVQGGSGGARMLLEDLVGECDDLSGRGGDPELSELATLVKEFLKFLSENDLFDDMRVINILSNVSSTVSQWANAPLDVRPGMLEEALGMLRDFKTHFE